MFKLATIAALIAETEPTNAALQSSSAVLVRAVYQVLSQRYRWIGEDGFPDDGEWDTIEAYVAALYSDIDTPLVIPPPPPIGGNMRIGTIFAVPSAIASFSEVGLLYCDGTSRLRVDYPDLYAMLNSAYIIDADTFKTPNLRGRILLGNGADGFGNTYGMGERGGLPSVTLTTAEMPTHNHQMRRMSSSTGTLDGWTTATDTSSSVRVAMPDMTTTNTGDGGSHDNMPPYETIRWYILALPD